MATDPLSRRDFARTVSVGLGAAFLTPEVALPQTPRVPAGPNDIRISSNENPYGPSPKALAAMTDSQRVAARYPDRLEEQMIAAIAKHHGLEPENVVLGCGSGEILRIADMAFTGAGKHVIVAEPTFEAVLDYAKVTRAEAVKVPQTADFRHDLPAMAAACTDKTALVYVCNPNNPTGTVVTRDELSAFLRRVPRSAVVLVDEAYHHFVEDPRYGSASDSAGKVPNLVVVRTFSKVYGMAGMRLGYALGTKENLQAMRTHIIWNNANAAVLEAALASLDEQDHVARQRTINRETREWLCGELKKDGRAYIPSHTNFVMIDVRADVEPIIKAFRDRGILVGRKFPSMSNWLRVSIGTREQMSAFVAGLRAIVPAAGRAA